VHGRPVEGAAVDEGGSNSTAEHVEVVVVGSGIAGLSAAITAVEEGRNVLLVDAADEQDRGGNTRYSIGVARVAYDGWQDLEEMLGSDAPADRPPALPYPASRYYADLVRASQGQGNPELQRIVAEGSASLVKWLRDHGARWTVTPFRFGRDPDRPGGPPALPPGAPLFAAGGGAAVVDALLDAGRSIGVQVRFGAAVRALVTGPSPGIELDPDGSTITAGSVVLAAGGFDANAAARTRYLGAGWDLIGFRGTRFNTGRVLDAAIEVGAASAGHWSGVHAVASDPNGSPHGDLSIGDVHGRYSYLYGITVNVRGERFFDEGADEKNFTYATVGRHIHAQPGGMAYQVFDDTAIELLEPRYATANPYVADSISELAGKLPVEAERFCQTVQTFNDACPAGTFDPYDLDGLAATPVGQPRKSNWAVPLSVPPFRAYAVVPKVSFAFGGLAIDAEARVLGPAGQPLPGLYACGDIVGGIAVHNLPAGTGMIVAGVLGRIAGESAARGVGAPTAAGQARGAGGP
jgi:tricarballylate dehydrogenase